VTATIAFLKELAMPGRARMPLLASFSLAAAILAAIPNAAHAQSFGFSISSGGHHHHHRHHHCGGWSFGYGYSPFWGPAYYAPPPAVIYTAPPPPQVVREIYVQPQQPAPLSHSPYSSTTTPSPSASLAANSAPSIAGSTSNDDRIVIRNSAGAQLPVSFLVDGQDVELAEGATRTFVGKTRRTIQYDRGGRFGTTHQDLAGGHYEFRITSSGWDLVRKPDVTPSSRTAIRSNSLPDNTAVSR
jgi:hypothetical protein